MIEIAFLADYPETIPTLCRWFQAQWPVYFAERSAEDIAQDFQAEAKRDGLPVRLVAFIDGELAGTLTLREQAISALKEGNPGLGGLFVAEQHRGRGVGTELVRAGMNLAWEQGYDRVYAATVEARGILERLGWKLVKAISFGDEQSDLYRCELTPPGSIAHTPSLDHEFCQDDQRQLLAALRSSADAWNRGDLKGHVAIYDPSVTVMTNNGPRPTIEAIVKSFGGAYFVNDKPRQQLRMESIAVRPLSADTALVTGRFILSGGEDPERSGWFTLIWVRTADGWRAVHDHTS